jgi:hypothetical protein
MGFALEIGFVEHLQLVITSKDYSQNYWVFGLYPLSGILENRKHDISETGHVSVLR